MVPKFTRYDLLPYPQPNASGFPPSRCLLQAVCRGDSFIPGNPRSVLDHYGSASFPRKGKWSSGDYIDH